MAKKTTLSFKDSLDSLFDAFDSAEGGLQDFPILAATPKTKPKTDRKRASTGKSFLGDLDEFFKDTLEETLAERLQDIKQGKKPVRQARRTKPLFGIDAIIQSTVDSTTIKPDFKEQKITLTFDVTKLDRLNEIADVEKARIKDIIDDLIVQYIAEYEEKKKGK